VTTRRIIETMANSARERLTRLGSSGEAFITVFDNLTIHKHVKNQRLLNHAEFLNLTACFVLLPPQSRRELNFSKNDLLQAEISNICMLDFMPTDQNVKYWSEGFLVGFNHVLKTISPSNVKMPRFEESKIHQIDPNEAPTIYTLRTYDCNESVITEVVRLLDLIKFDTGVSDEESRELLSMFSGDLMSIKNLRFGAFGF
jgi:hypothetical protein